MLIRQYKRAGFHGKPLFQAVSRQIIHKWWEELNLIYATSVSIDGDFFYFLFFNDNYDVTMIQINVEFWFWS